MKLKVLSLVLVFFSLVAVAGSGLAVSDPAGNYPAVTSSLPDHEKNPVPNVLTTPEDKLLLAEQKFTELYESIDYGQADRPAYDVFRKAMVGYYNLQSQKKLSDKGILTLIDFGLPSVQKRMWIVDLVNRKLLFHDLVAHGKNSGNDMATSFSNIPESHQSSLGFYITANTYFGKHGLSLRLSGQEAGINDKAMARAIVMHGADYVNNNITKSLGRLGRSFGCPAVSREIAKDVIETVADGTLMFIYHPSQDYLTKSALLQEAGAIDYLLAGTF